MADDDYLKKRMAEETAKIKVDPYQKTASLGGWAGGARTLWAISTIGIVMGAIMGAVAPFFPAIVDTALLPTIATVGKSVAAFAAAGLSFGFGGGLVLGRISGTAAAVAQEQEERMKKWTVKQMLSQNPSASILPDQPEEKSPPQSRSQRIKDNYHTFINPRIGATFAVIGAIGGLVMAAAFIATGGAMGAVMPALEAITGGSLVGNNAALIAYSMGVCATMGSFWCINMSKITSEVTHFYGKLMSGKIVGREWAPKKGKEPVQEPQTAQPSLSEPQIAEPAAARKFESFKDLVAQQTAQREANEQQLIPR